MIALTPCKTGDAWRRPFSVRRKGCDGTGRRSYFFFAALFLAVFRAPVLRRGAAFFLLAPRLDARFFGAARFFVALRLVDFFAARFFGAARFFVAFLAARFFGALRFVVFLAADFFGAALRFFAFFFGAAAGAVGVIIDIMSAIIVASPV
jgi:hypothetical protein